MDREDVTLYSFGLLSGNSPEGGKPDHKGAKSIRYAAESPWGPASGDASCRSVDQKVL